jgi:hypothetical protein
VIPQTWLIAGGALLVVGIGAGIKGYGMGAASVQAEWDSERVRLAAEVQAATEKVRNIEHNAVQNAAKQRERADENVRSIERRHRAALERLRQQAASNGDGSVPGGAAAQLAECAAEGVAAGDGGVVVGADFQWPLDYAADAARLQVALDACIEQYNGVRAAFNADQ